MYIYPLCTLLYAEVILVTGQIGIGQIGIGQNGTDKMVANFRDSSSTELNFHSVTTSHK